MVQDCLDYPRRCKAFQFQANFIHQPLEVLQSTVVSWPFDAWGLDVVGPLPKFFGGHLYILVAIDYFSKWAEGERCCPQGNNGKSFDNKLMNKICDLFGFKQCNSSLYNATTNGLAEAFNKTLCNLLKRVVSKSKRDWNGVIQEGITDKDNTRLQLAELEALDEKRLEAQQSLGCYQARLSRTFNKRVRPISFQVGDQVLAIRRSIISSHKSGGKFTSKWDRPYVMQEAYSDGAYKLIDVEGLRNGPINGKFLKKYYP
ncbi:uncharacterized protein [Nicotiana tomentosiformis]|uniref:uncharacterized protein n=1 Tax=Nicotiana tomentosiformis TaxID=4098 RepID=UPI00388C7B9A